MKKPTFLFIGPDKTGSKWIHDILLQHPSCYVPVLADPYFFDRYYERGLEWYFGLFRDAPSTARAIGELSHDYLFSPIAADRIARDLPGVQLVACLRNPVERSFSQYLSLLRGGITREPFEVALLQFPELIHNSRYATHLKAYLTRFPRDRIKVLWYEQLVEDPRGFATELFAFLGVPFLDTVDYAQRFNPASGPRGYWVARLARKAVNLARDLGFTNLVGWVKRSRLRELFYRPYRPEERPRLTPVARARLVSVFEEEVRRLEDMLQVDLARWRA